MIKKLKIKLIAICLLSVGIVLSIIISTSYIASIINITYSTDKLINILYENNGTFGENSKVDIDTKYQTRYFVVKVYDGSVKPDEINVTNSNISNERAKRLANSVLRGFHFDRGYKEGFRYFKYDIEDGSAVIFIDCNRQLFTLRFMLGSAFIISLLSLLTIFSLLRLFANRILKPIIDAHEKQKKFITNASHELKTPLTVINANNELLEMEYGENEYTQNINKQVVKLTSMTNNLVMLSKIDEVNILTDLADFSLSEAANETVSSLAKTINKEFTYTIDEDIIYYGNEKLIRDLISLLLDNARKYSLTYVNFSIYKSKGKVHIKSENDAENITKGNLIHFAERFYRSEESRVSVFGGTGIGLSLVKDIVETHKGNLKIYSPDGKICKIHIIL